MRFAESYDEASWFRARCAYLEYKNYELEEQLKKNDECEVCNVSMKNEGGCDCQIIACANCGEDGEKYKYNLCDDGKLRCDDCAYDGATDDEEEEESEDEDSDEEDSDEEDTDPYDPMRRVGQQCQSSDCENKLTTEHECRAMMCLSCIEQWRIYDEQEMTRIHGKGWKDKFQNFPDVKQCGDNDWRCEDCTHCARTRVCGDCGCVGGCYNDCVNVLA